MATNETNAKNGLQVNGGDVISPRLSEAELLWVQRYDELRRKSKA